MLEPIHDGDVSEALALLARGFPSRSPQFWQNGLARLAKYHGTADGGPLGYLLRIRGEDVGIMLTMRSRRVEGAASRRVLNLSSWYVDEPHRWLAPRMLQKVLGEDADLVTDLTPSPPVRQMIGGLGFKPWREGVLLAVLGLSAMQIGRPASVGPLDAPATNTLDPATRSLVEDHVDLGCIALAMTIDGTVHPLVFSRTRRKHLPSVRLVYAPSAAAVRGNIGPIARFLLTRGIALLEIPANREESAFGAWFTTRPPPTFARGTVDPDLIDHAYSEFVFLQI